MSSVQLNIPPMHLPRSEKRAGTAKAALRKPENETAALLGQVIAEVFKQSKLNLDEFAREVKRDQRQVARWFDASERPQIETVFAVEAFRPLVVLAMATLIRQQIEVETVIRIRSVA